MVASTVPPCTLAATPLHVGVSAMFCGRSLPQLPIREGISLVNSAEWASPFGAIGRVRQA
eukprot:1809502-Pyramimonas_sp.AAC.1